MISLHVLSLDGALLAACLNAASIALIDAGVPMPSIMAAVSSGCIVPTESNVSKPEPVLDLNDAEEQELPFLSLATVLGEQGEEDRVSIITMESRCQMSGGQNILESMVGVGMDGCKQVRRTLEDVIRKHGAKVTQGPKR